MPKTIFRTLIINNTCEKPELARHGDAILPLEPGECHARMRFSVRAAGMPRFAWLMLFSTLCSFGFLTAQSAEDENAPAKRHTLEADLNRHEEADKNSPPPKGAVLFVGSSSVCKWETVEKDMAPLKVLSRGFCGSKSADAIRFADRFVIPLRSQSHRVLRGGQRRDC